MAENLTSKKYTVPSVAISTPLVAVVIDDEVRLVDATTDEDRDDILASREASRQPGKRISIDAFRKQLGI